MASNGDGGKRRWKPPRRSGDADDEKGSKEKSGSKEKRAGNGSSDDSGAGVGPRY